MSPEEQEPEYTVGQHELASLRLKVALAREAVDFAMWEQQLYPAKLKSVVELGKREQELENLTDELADYTAQLTSQQVFHDENGVDTDPLDS